MVICLGVEFLGRSRSLGWGGLFGGGLGRER